jgi:hypothetical protein
MPAFLMFFPSVPTGYLPKYISFQWEIHYLPYTLREGGLLKIGVYKCVIRAPEQGAEKDELRLRPQKGD